MRSVALLFVLFFSAAVPIAEPAFAVESKILDTFKSWLSDEPDINDLEGLRRLAAKENPEAQFLLFKHYISHSRQGAGPRVANETLASRARRKQGCAPPPSRAIPKRSAGWGASSRAAGRCCGTGSRRANGSSSPSRRGYPTPGPQPSTCWRNSCCSRRNRRMPIDSAAWR